MKYRLIHGDCLDVMRTLDAGSVDAVVTDPPYGLEFMGKDWDAPWKQGFAAFGMKDGDRRAAPVFGSKRNPVCLACHKHKRGSKRCECATPDYDETPATFAQMFGSWCETWAVEALRVAKPGAHLLAFGGTRTFHRLTCAIEDAGWEIRDCLSWLYGSGFPKSHNGPWGGTALKPAWEPIILARKPLVGTVKANHAEHGTGAINIDGCRIGPPLTPEEIARSGRSTRVFGDATAGGVDWKRNGRDGEPSADRRYTENGGTDFAALPGPRGGDDKGRWPANVVLDEDAAAMLDEQSGECASGSREAGEFQQQGFYANAIAARPDGMERAMPSLDGSTGGASRFFYTAKASRSERNAGLDGMTERKPHANEPNGRAWDIPGSHSTKRANFHPTVKPVDLMRWLVRLVTPAGGLVLDPFTGSGTTGVAALEEGCSFVGIEREAEYVAIAEARLRHAAASPLLPFATEAS